MAAVFVITTDGQQALADYAGTFLAWLKTLTLRLYSNNRGTPLTTDHLAAYTECLWSGYAGQLQNDWTEPGVDGNNNYLFAFPDRTFTQTGTVVTETVWGAFWTEPVGGKLAMVQSRATGLAMDTVGNECIVHANPGVAIGQLSGAP